MRAQLGVDLALIGSGSIRGETLGPIVTLQDLLEVFPYQNPVIGFRLTGQDYIKLEDEPRLVIHSGDQ